MIYATLIKELLDRNCIPVSCFLAYQEGLADGWAMKNELDEEAFHKKLLKTGQALDKALEQAHEFAEADREAWRRRGLLR